MARRQNDPLRPLTAEERATLVRTSRASSERADRVTRAQALLAVADGASSTAAARVAGRRSGDGVAQLVARFNRHGRAALASRHGGGAPVRYGSAERERILRAFRRPPDREQDGTATWSLTTLQRALRRAPDGLLDMDPDIELATLKLQRALRRAPDDLPQVSTWTILQTLWEAGYTCQQDRTWCHTGTATRKRKDGTVVPVTDPETTPQKT